METIDVGGVRLACRQEGAGQPILFLPPLGTSHAAFNHLLRRLPPGRAIFFDPKGVGKSDRPEAGYSVEASAEEAWALLDRLGVDGAVLFGVSYGGAVAQAMARRSPGRIRGLILVSTWSAPDRHRAELVRVWQDLYGQVPMDLFYREVHLWTFSPAFYRRSEAEIRRLQDALAREQGHPTPAVFRQMAEAALTFDGRGFLKDVRAPVQILVGGEDRITPPEEGARLAAQVPGARLSVVPGRGHGLLWEEPQVALDALEETLKAVEVRAG